MTIEDFEKLLYENRCKVEKKFNARLQEDGFWHWKILFIENRDYFSGGCAVVEHILMIGIDFERYKIVSNVENTAHGPDKKGMSNEELQELCFKNLENKIIKIEETFLPCAKCGSNKIQYTISPGDDKLVEGCQYAETKCLGCGENYKFSIHFKENTLRKIVRTWNVYKGQDNDNN